MNGRYSLTPRFAFYGICLIAIAWLAITIPVELHLGWPANGLQWAKRIVGWGVEIWLLRTLIFGVQRCRLASLK